MSDAVLWFITLATGLLSLLVVAGLVCAIVFTAHIIRKILIESPPSGASKESAMVLSWLTMFVAATLIIALLGLQISVIMALTQAWLEVASIA